MSHVINFKISGPSLKLKHLETYSCVLENLVSFKYMGAMINLSFNYTPQLIKASFARPYACYIIKSLFQPPSYLFQLQTPVLDIGTEVSMKVQNFAPPTPLFLFFERKNIEIKVEGLSIFVVI